MFPCQMFLVSINKARNTKKPTQWLNLIFLKNRFNSVVISIASPIKERMPKEINIFFINKYVKRLTTQPQAKIIMPLKYGRLPILKQKPERKTNVIQIDCCHITRSGFPIASIFPKRSSRS